MVIFPGFRDDFASKVLDPLNFLHVGGRRIRPHQRTINNFANDYKDEMTSDKVFVSKLFFARFTWHNLFIHDETRSETCLS